MPSFIRDPEPDHAFDGPASNRTAGPRKYPAPLTASQSGAGRLNTDEFSPYDRFVYILSAAILISSLSSAATDTAPTGDPWINAGKPQLRLIFSQFKTKLTKERFSTVLSTSHSHRQPSERQELATCIWKAPLPTSPAWSNSAAQNGVVSN